MARKTALTDDITGEFGAYPWRFSVRGIEYEIDLTEENFAKFLTAIDPWRSRARVAQKSRTNKAPVMSEEDRLKIRIWATENGIILAKRGRFPNHVVQAYYNSVEDAELSATLSVEEIEKVDPAELELDFA